MRETAKKTATTVARKAKQPAPAAKPAADKPKKEKRIHDRFSLPSNDYALIRQLKSVMKAAGHPVKKNDLLGAGLRSLKAMTGEELLAAIAALELTGPARGKKPR